MALSVGDEAPTITTVDARGEPFDLSALRGRRAVVLFFFPRAFTPGCTAEACSFRDAHAELVAEGVEVVGVSTDGADRQARFIAEHQLPFRILPDPAGRIARAFGVLGRLRSVLGVAARTTFVLDRRGIVRGIFRHELLVHRHVDDVKQALARLS